MRGKRESAAGNLLDLPGAEEVFKPLLTHEEYRAAGLTEDASLEDLERKYRGGPRDNLMNAVKQPLRILKVPVTQSDLEQVDELCMRYELDRVKVVQALVRYALSKRREWEQGGGGDGGPDEL